MITYYIKILPLTGIIQVTTEDGNLAPPEVRTLVLETYIEAHHPIWINIEEGKLPEGVREIIDPKTGKKRFVGEIRIQPKNPSSILHGTIGE